MRFAAAALLLLAACSHDAPASSALAGAAGMPSFHAPVAFYNRENGIQVLVSDDPDACDHLLTAGSHRSVVIEPDGTEPPSLFLEMSQGHFLGNGTRTVGDDLAANFDPGASQVELDGNSLCGASAVADGGCVAVGTLAAVSGTVQLSRNDDDTQSDSITAGTLALNFGDAGALAGDFRATPCGALHAGCGSAGGGFSFLAGLAVLGLRRRLRSLAGRADVSWSRQPMKIFATLSLALAVALALALSACLVPDVNLEGKSCSQQLPCDDGYICVAAICQSEASLASADGGGTSGSTGH